MFDLLHTLGTQHHALPAPDERSLRQVVVGFFPLNSAITKGRSHIIYWLHTKAPLLSSYLAYTYACQRSLPCFHNDNIYRMANRSYGGPLWVEIAWRSYPGQADERLFWAPNQATASIDLINPLW